MFGCVTPNLSIRFLNTSKAEVIDSSILRSMIGFTCSLVIPSSISSSKFLLKKILGEARVFSPGSASKASKKDSKYVS